MKPEIKVQGNRIILPQLHHGGQQELVYDKVRFKIVRAGRRWGKTFAAAVSAMRYALAGKRVWWVAPTHQVAREGWNYLVPMARSLKRYFPEVRIVRSIGDKHIELPSGGIIEIRSAGSDRIDQTLRGAGLDFIVIDEAAMLDDYVWQVILRPALIDTKGDVMIMSTPKGRNWFYQLHEVAKTNTDYKTYHFTSYDNPYIDRKEIDQLKREMSPGFFMQEIMAEFVDLSGSVFGDVSRHVASWSKKDPVPGHVYIMGVDWGRYYDYTAVAIVDWIEANKAEVVYIERIEHMDFSDQIEHIVHLYNLYRPHIVVSETNSLGIAPTEALEMRGLPVFPQNTTNVSKKTILLSLAMAIERGDVVLPNVDELIKEMMSVKMETNPRTGLVRISAAEGANDDLVMALALAYSFLKDAPDISWISL